ncbi:MAG: hypothetical protein MUF29_10100 [Chitinophagaceae bacterium]|jgi:hypothetical protein|nr:hypothetical protein [Chitinophagaceae bacterium]
MKRHLLTGALALASLLTYADPTPASGIRNFRASENLKALFGNVRNVDWQPAMNSMIKASFTSYEEEISVFFNAEGEYVATTRAVTTSELPMRLRLAMEQKFGSTPIEQLFELTSEKDNSWYFQTTDKKGRKRVWRGFENGRIEDFRTL